MRRSDRRFVVEFAPGRPGRATEVALVDRGCFPPRVLADVAGDDQAAALLNLWATVRADTADALACVTGAYRKRTGRQLRPWPPSR
jgi:hypothetical protein